MVNGLKNISIVLLDMKHNCSNCNKIGHSTKQCIYPITSIGICCFKLNSSLKNIFNNNKNKVSYYDIDNNYNLNMSNIFKFNKYIRMVQFLLVRRKHSLNYIDFIKGKYNLMDIDNIVNMFNHMSISEVENIKHDSFNDLWNKLWNKTANYKIYNNEMIQSGEKFNKMKELGILDNVLNRCTPYSSPEWEIPKGRRDFNESNINCAIREFEEETTMNTSDYNILNCINPIHDNFIGTNNIEYKHIFYIGQSTDNTILDSTISDSNISTILDSTISTISDNNNEIDLIKWCYWDEVLQLLRPYNENKIKIITSIFLFIINISEYKVISDLNITL